MATSLVRRSGRPDKSIIMARDLPSGFRLCGEPNWIACPRLANVVTPGTCRQFGSGGVPSRSRNGLATDGKRRHVPDVAAVGRE